MNVQMKNSLRGWWKEMSIHGREMNGLLYRCSINMDMSNSV